MYPSFRHPVRTSRRSFGALCLALAVSALPLRARAQPARVYRLGYLSSLSASGGQRFFDAFRQGLRELGYTEGRSIVIESRWADGDYERLPLLAKELVSLHPDVILSSGGPPAARAAKAATTTVPIVFLSGEAVRSGLVANLARPGANLTGFDVLAEELDAKRLGLLKEALPDALDAAVLWNPASPAGPLQQKHLVTAARALNLKIQFVGVRHPGELGKAFTAMARERPGALLVTADPMFLGAAQRIGALAAAGRLPAIAFAPEFAESGGLLSYAADFAALHHRAAIYIDKILKGARPAELPVEQPTKFELVVNLKIARALGLSMPQSILLRADRVIE